MAAHKAEIDAAADPAAKRAELEAFYLNMTSPFRTPATSHVAAAMGAITKGHSQTEDELLIAPLEHCIEQMGQAEAFHTEHEEIDRTLMLIQKVKSVSKARQLMLSAVTASRAHFNKEERILFPMAEKVLNIGSLKNLAGSWQRHTLLSVWLLDLGIGIRHGRPCHPQTQGKEERFHRTLKAEVLDGRIFDDIADAQRAFNCWRPIYNGKRPHEALGMSLPISRYEPSPRSMPNSAKSLQESKRDGNATMKQFSSGIAAFLFPTSRLAMR